MRKQRTKWGHSYSPEEIGARLNNVEPEEQTGEELRKDLPAWMRKAASLPSGRSDSYYEEYLEEERAKQAKVEALRDAVESRRAKGNVWGITKEQATGVQVGGWDKFQKGT